MERPGDRPRAEYKFQDSAPVNIRLSLLRLNGVALAGESGEVLTSIFQHLKQLSPLNTIMVTHTNGSSGYIPGDGDFDQVSYEITTSHLKPLPSPSFRTPLPQNCLDMGQVMVFHLVE